MTSLEKILGAATIDSRLDFRTKLKLLKNNKNNLIVRLRIFEFPIFLRIPQVLIKLQGFWQQN